MRRARIHHVRTRRPPRTPLAGPPPAPLSRAGAKHLKPAIQKVILGVRLGGFDTKKEAPPPLSREVSPDCLEERENPRYWLRQRSSELHAPQELSA